MSNITFSPLCCNCFSEIQPSEGGLVLSCGDFLCLKCESMCDLRHCPGCFKVGTKQIKLTDPKLPGEVLHSMTDITKQLEMIHSTLSFQIKHYKVTLKRAVARKAVLSKNSFSESESLIPEDQVNSSPANDIRSFSHYNQISHKHQLDHPVLLNDTTKVNRDNQSRISTAGTNVSSKSLATFQKGIGTSAPAQTKSSDTRLWDNSHGLSEQHLPPMRDKTEQYDDENRDFKTAGKFGGQINAIGSNYSMLGKRQISSPRHQTPPIPLSQTLPLTPSSRIRSPHPPLSKTPSKLIASSVRNENAPNLKKFIGEGLF